MNLPNDQIDKVAEAFADVTIRFHEHEKYGSKQDALKALKRRCPKILPVEYERIFDFHIALLEATIQAFAEFVKSSQFSPRGPVAGLNDIDYQAIVEKLRLRFPGENPAPLQTFVNWVFFWHYLK